MSLEMEIEQFIKDFFVEVNRPDLFREPLVGFSSADNPKYEELKSLIGPWHKRPDEFLPSAKSVISFFVPFSKAVVKSPRKEGEPVLWGEAYQVVNKQFGILGERLKAFLEEKGFEAFTIPATHTYDPKTQQASWSHRSAAVISGLGTFGINRIVITPKGSGGRFCNVITSAELEPSLAQPEELCTHLNGGSCGACMYVCPVGALSFDGFDSFKCQDHLNKNAEALSKDADGEVADVCGKCIALCPKGYLE